MSGFHEESLPLALALGASGGPTRRTDVVTLGSGQEQRNTPWLHSRRRYELAGAVRGLDDLHTLIAFFEARRGRLFGFRFRDPSDWRSGSPARAVGPFDQNLGFGDGQSRTFSLQKRYGSGNSAYVRPIRKPVAASVRVAVAGQEIASFGLDPTNGTLTLPNAPPIGSAITCGFHFDTPVRFDTDRLELSLDAFAAGRAVSVPLIEILA